MTTAGFSGPVRIETKVDLPPPWRRVAFDIVGSTNDEAKRLAGAGAPHGTVVTARRQEAGRGRRGRSWVSPEGNLFASLVLRPEGSAARAGQLSFVASLALVEALRMLLPQARAVCAKWPNDVLIDGAKVSGILLESEAAPDGGVEWLVLGVGVNVRHHPGGTPYPATSLTAMGVPDDRGPDVVLARFLDRFGTWWDRWREGGFEAVRGAWLANAQGLGEPVTVRLDRETVEGRFVDVDGDGTLVLELPRAGSRRFAAGEVFFGTGGRSA